MGTIISRKTFSCIEGIFGGIRNSKHKAADYSLRRVLKYDCTSNIEHKI